MFLSSFRYITQTIILFLNCNFYVIQDCLTPLSMQALPDSPESLCIAEMGGTEGRDGEPGVQGRLYLNIGMSIYLILSLRSDKICLSTSTSANPTDINYF